MKYTILFLSLLFFGASIWSNSLPMKEESDKFYDEYHSKLMGTKAEILMAIDQLKAVKSLRALRPLTYALKGEVFKPESAPFKYLSMQKVDQNNASIYMAYNAPIIKFFAARAIAEINHEEGVKPLTEEYAVREKDVKEDDRIEFTDPEDYPLVLSVAEILRCLGELPYKPESLDTFKKALEHKNPFIRAAAADGLRNTGRASVIEVLEPMAEKEKNDYARAAILGAIVGVLKTENKHFVNLVELLKHKDPYVREKVSQTIAESNIRAAESSLRQAIMIEDNIMVRNRMKRDLTSLISFKYPVYANRQK